MKVLDFRGVSRSWLEDFRSGLSATTENSLAFLQEAGRSVSLGARADESNVHSDFCKAEGIPVIRNTMPHNAVGYHDSGEFRLCAAINNTGDYIVSNAGIGQRCFAKVVTTALHSLGIDAECEGNNILISDKKIGTFTVYQFGEVIIFNAHILLDWDIDTAEKSIISPKHDMREGIRTLKQLGRDISFDKMKEAFLRAWQNTFGVKLEQ